MNKKVYKFYVGIDVSKAKLDVALQEENPVLAFSNDEEGIKQLALILPAPSKTLVVMEASGGYEQYSACLLREKGFHVAIVNAKRVRDHAKAEGKLAKTDKLDARLIRRYGQVYQPFAQTQESTLQRDLNDYAKRREQLIKLLTLEKQHQEQASAAMKKKIQRLIRTLEQELEELDQEL